MDDYTIQRGSNRNKEARACPNKEQKKAPQIKKHGHAQIKNKKKAPQIKKQKHGCTKITPLLMKLNLCCTQALTYFPCMCP